VDAEAPGTLLVQKRSQRPQTTPVVRRITAEGDFFEFTDQDVRVEGGKVVIHTVEATWRKKFVIPANRLDDLRTALRDTEFFDLPAQHSPAATVSDGGDVTWTACLDGREHAVTLHGSPFTDVPAIARLDQTFEEVVADAADASSD